MRAQDNAKLCAGITIRSDLEIYHNATNSMFSDGISTGAAEYAGLMYNNVSSDNGKLNIVIQAKWFNEDSIAL